MIIYNGQEDFQIYKSIFGETMEQICNEDSNVVYLDCDLMNSIGTRDFWKKNHKQAINCGIAEANMIGIAAGLSAAGKKPYVHTFGPFASRRCYDQIFLSGAYAGNSIRIFGSDPGITAIYNGGTHMPFEDIALLRAVPESTVIEISDAAMLKWTMHAIKERVGVTYVRTTRKAYPTIYSLDHTFDIGKGEIVRDGNDLSIIACGIMLGEALKAADLLSKDNIQARDVDCFTIKPIDTELVLRCARETGKIITAENHNIIGGLGDAVGDVIIQHQQNVTMKKIGVNDCFGSVGHQEYLQNYYGLTAEKIVETARSFNYN